MDLIDKNRTVTEPDARLAKLTARMEQRGADDPAGWARSEITENIAQQARYLFLRRLWPEAIDGWRDRAVLSRQSATRCVLEQGAHPADLSRAMRLAAYEAVFTVLSILDEGYDPDAPEDAPGWRLMETGPLSDELTGRDVGGLHEDFLTLDPSGRQGSDLFDQFLRAIRPTRQAIDAGRLRDGRRPAAWQQYWQQSGGTALILECLRRARVDTGAMTETES
jgi:hypothetical protein